MGIKELIEKYEKDSLENILRRLYIDEDLSIAEISKELEISVGSVHQWLADYQITKQKKMWKN